MKWHHAFLLVLSSCAAQTPVLHRPDVVRVFVARRIQTLDPRRPVVGALAVRNGRIVAAGSEEEAFAAVGESAQRVNLGEVTVIPGPTDAHAHLSLLGQSLSMVNLVGAASPEEVVARLRAAKPEQHQHNWLLGAGWDQNLWVGASFPGRAALDAAFPEKPVLLYRVDRHAVWANGAALNAAGIDSKTPEPAGGRILKDPQGEPTGVLTDNAIELIHKALPSPTDEQLEQRLRAALARMAQAGMTGVHDAGMDLRTYRLLQRWDMAGSLPLHVYAMADGQGADWQTFLDEGTYRGRRLTLRAVKLVLDGSLGSRGAALHAPYTDDPAHKGQLLLSPSVFESRVQAFMARHFQVAVHAIGDRANTLALEVLNRSAEATGTRAGRHRIEHAQVVRTQDLPLFKQGNLIASVQPTHAVSDMPWAQNRLGPERIKEAYAWKSLKNAGARLALGSDAPVESPDLMNGLVAARTRQDAKGNPPEGWFPKQRLTAREALEGFTVDNAWASFEEAERGRLSPGMDADFVAVSIDPMEAFADELRGARVITTVVGGEFTYTAPRAGP